MPQRVEVELGSDPAPQTGSIWPPGCRSFLFPTFPVSEIKTLSWLSANSRREGPLCYFWGLSWCGILITLAGWRGTVFLDCWGRGPRCGSHLYLPPQPSCSLWSSSWVSGLGIGASRLEGERAVIRTLSSQPRIPSAAKRDVMKVRKGTAERGGEPGARRLIHIHNHW